MRCPICHHDETKVVDSRVASDGTSIRRRRECEKCEFRFSTLEAVELLDLTVIKRDGRREPYHREKLLRGLERALEKRPYTEASFEKLFHNVERGIQKKKSGEITSGEIGEIVMNELKRFDKVAYVRFASVYRSFEDVSRFEEVLRGLKKGKRAKTRKR